MGKTIVVCGVKAEIAEPGLDTPDLGFIGGSFDDTDALRIQPVGHELVPNIDLPAMCSPKFKPGPPSEEAQVLSERLCDALVRFVSGSFFCAVDRTTLGPTCYHSTRSAYRLAERYGAFTSTRHASITTETLSMQR